MAAPSATAKCLEVAAFAAATRNPVTAMLARTPAAVTPLSPFPLDCQNKSAAYGAPTPIHICNLPRLTAVWGEEGAADKLLRE